MMGKYKKGQTIVFVHNGKTSKTVISWLLPTLGGIEYYTDWGVIQECNIKAVV